MINGHFNFNSFGVFQVLSIFKQITFRRKVCELSLEPLRLHGCTSHCVNPSLVCNSHSLHFKNIACSLLALCVCLPVTC